jgi:formylglycine-generating enzyme required for sulfatase activity
MRKLLLFILVSFCTTSVALSADNRDCSRHLAPSADSITGRLVSYMSDLLDHQVIGDVELLRLEESLKQRRVENPISEETAQTQAALLIHREGLQELIDESESEPFDLAFLLKWVEQKLTERGQVREQREVVREETKNVHQLIKFAEIRPGKFMMEYEKRKNPGVKTEIKKPFGFQVTHVTQYQWVRVMDENPSHFKKGEQTIQITVNGKTTELQPNNPVEQVKFSDVQKFIRQLNLLAKNKDPLIKELIPDHQEGDVYDLPADEQLEFVMRNRGRSNGSYFFGDNESKLKEYAWYDENSDLKTHPVAQLKPLIIDGQEIWDIVGNVWAWTKTPLGSSRAVRGGGWINDAQNCRSAFSCSCLSGNYNVGFRLVRTREQAK